MLSFHQSRDWFTVVAMRNLLAGPYLSREMFNITLLQSWNAVLLKHYILGISGCSVLVMDTLQVNISLFNGIHHLNKKVLSYINQILNFFNQSLSSSLHIHELRNPKQNYRLYKNRENINVLKKSYMIDGVLAVYIF